MRYLDLHKKIGLKRVFAYDWLLIEKFLLMTA
jgi:hypothetical protein